MLRDIKLFILETVEVILISAAIILPIRYFLVQPFFVKGQSMEPTFYDGDYLIIDELSFRFREPQRGEVVVFRFPQQPSQFYIKRIIGLPGETIEILAGKINITTPSGEKFLLSEPYLKNKEKTLGNLKITLEKNQYFVLGDNRDSSYDSRRWGPLPKDNIVGRVWIRPWPFDSFEVFAAPIYLTEPE
ncbi:MAG: signal peptidase I [Candidatus Paceibacteria bacterium]